MFVIYINDLPDNLKSECYMFADDTKVFKDINDIEDNKILQKIQSRLPPSSSILVHLSNTYSNWSDVDRPEMKPNCFGENKVFLFIWFTIWEKDA
jgi:hypothetical protein